MGFNLKNGTWEDFPEEKKVNYTLNSNGCCPKCEGGYVVGWTCYDKECECHRPLIEELI